MCVGDQLFALGWLCYWTLDHLSLNLKRRKRKRAVFLSFKVSVVSWGLLQMQFQVFAVPASGDRELVETLNRFLRSHRVLQVERRFKEKTKSARN